MRHAQLHNRSLRLSKACKKRTAMSQKPDTSMSGPDAISSQTDASSLPRSAWSPPASLLLKFDVQTRGRMRTTKPNEHQANEHPPFVGAPGTSSIVRCSRTRRQHLPLTISRGNCQWVLVVLASARPRGAGRCESPDIIISLHAPGRYRSRRLVESRSHALLELEQSTGIPSGGGGPHPVWNSAWL